MDPQPGASFIPKKPLIAGIERRGGALGSIFLLLSLVLFIGSVLLAGAVFAYQQYLNGLLQSRSESLEKAQAAYDPSVLQNLVRLDGRIKQSQAVLENHIAPSSLFSFLENTTLENVRFTSFDYSMGGSGATLTLSGEALDFATVALQSDEFGKSRVLKDILFSDINVNDNGRVRFSVKAAVDPSFLLYSSYLQALAAAPEASAPVPATEEGGASPMP